MLSSIEHSSQTNHNGGWIGFKPSQPGNNTPAAERHHLYMAVGDGGGSNDPNNNGQNTNTLLGSMLRLDVSGSGAATIPTDNPFATRGAPQKSGTMVCETHGAIVLIVRQEIFMIADVGQNSFEEVNLHANGARVALTLDGIWPKGIVRIRVLRIRSTLIPT